MFNINGKKTEHLSISITVKKTVTEISNVLVPVDENCFLIDSNGIRKLNSDKIFNKALEMAEKERDWIRESENFSINDIQIPKEEIG